jgi:hypothetical protein
MSDIQEIVDALQEHLRSATTVNGHRYPVAAITCRDGAKFSIQAGVYLYCTPRNNSGPWTHVEVMPLDDQPTKFECDDGSVAAYVPIEDVAAEILSRGFLAIQSQPKQIEGN